MMKPHDSEVQHLDEAAEQFVESLRRGENPSPDEYAERYPQLAEEILEVLPVLALIEGAAGKKNPSAHTASPAPALEVTLPRQIGDYLVLREIGRGGMGIVYEAQQLSLRRRVALKLLPTHAVLNPAQLERFRREAQAAASLQHRNIVPVHEVADQHGIHFYAMQYVRGAGLDHVIREIRQMREATSKLPSHSASTAASNHLDDLASTVASGLLRGRFASDDTRNGCPDPPSTQPQPARAKLEVEAPNSEGKTLGAPATQPTPAYFRSVARIGVEVSDALAYAHRQGVLHRDIKPSNVLVDTSGTAWVTDFGLAKTDGAENLTNTGDVAGTIRYMAPERLRGWSDPRSDVYGVGLTLYEMATLRPAFDEPDQGRLIARIARDNPPQPRQLVSSVPKDLETIILKSTSKEPAQRYASAGELVADLNRFLAGEPISARRASRLERTRLWCRRNPLSASLAGSVAMLLVLLAAGSTVAALWLRQERDSAVEAGRLAVASQQSALREADRARKEAAKAEEINRLLQEAFALANPNNAPGEEVTVREVLDRAVEKLADGLAKQPEVEAALRDTIGWTYRGLGQLEKAESQLRESLALRRSVLGDAHPDVATSLEHLSIVLGGMGVPGRSRNDEAIALCHEAIDIRRDALGPDHPDTRAVEAFLLFLQQRSAAGATPTVEDATAWLSLRVPGIDDVEQSFDRVRTLWRSGQRDETMRFIDEQTAPAREGFVNPARFADGMGMIGAQRVNAKDYDVAEPILRATLKLYRSEYGEEHPSIARTLYALGNALNGKGKADAAEHAYRESVALERRLLGNEHPQLARTLYSLAHLLQTKRKDYENAETLYREALAIQRKMTSDRDPWITWTLQSLAGLLYKQDRKLDEAEALYREALNIRRRVFGDDEPETAWSLHLLAKLLHYGRGRHKEAEALYREALRVRRQALGNSHADTASSIQFLAKLLHYQQRQYDEAEALYREAVEIRQQTLGLRNPNTARSMYHLACLLHEQKGDLDEAEALLRKALAIFEQTLTADHLSVAEARAQLARLEGDRQRPPSAAAATNE